MKFAIPLVEKKLSAHFGHCQEFALVDADVDKKEITNIEYVIPPEHEPGLLPKWLGEKKCNVIVAGGMGVRAQDLFTANNIKVVVGAPTEDAKTIVKSYLNDALVTGGNVCDH